MNKSIGTFLLNILLVAEVCGQSEKIDSLQKILAKGAEDTTYVNNLNALSWELIGSGQYQRAIPYAQQARVLAQKIKYKKGESKAYNYLGGALWSQGKYPEALKNYYEALKIAQEINFKNGIAMAYNNMGLVYWTQGRYADALEVFLISLKATIEIGDKKALINSYNNIGLIYYKLKNEDEALKNYLLSLNIAKELNDKRGIVQANNNMALIYQDLGNYTGAIDRYLSNIKTATEIGDKRTVAYAYCNLGIIKFSQGQLKESMQNHLTSLKIIEEMGTKNGLALNYINMGRIDIVFKKFDEANAWIQKGLDVSKEIGDMEGMKDSYNSLYALDSASGNWKEALEHHKLFIEFRDSLFNIENTKKAVEARLQYDFEIRETKTKAAHDKQEALANAEIGRQKIIRNSIAGGTGILIFSSVWSFVFYKRRRDTAFQKKEAEIKQQEAELKQQVSEVEMKALRSQMNPHFIFNSLNSIYRYMDQHDMEKAGDYLVRFSKLIRLILENSMHEEVPLQEDMHALELYMQLEAMRLHNKFDFSFEIDEKLDAEEVMVPPLLLQPFVENAIWHGLSEKKEMGHITIRIKKHNDQTVKCEVEDNGVGRKNKPVEVHGMKEKKGSLGIAITKERIELLNRKKGTHADFMILDLVDSDMNALGTKVEVMLPVDMGA